MLKSSLSADTGRSSRHRHTDPLDHRGRSLRPDIKTKAGYGSKDPRGRRGETVMEHQAGEARRRTGEEPTQRDTPGSYRARTPSRPWPGVSVCQLGPWETGFAFTDGALRPRPFVGVRHAPEDATPGSAHREPGTVRPPAPGTAPFIPKRSLPPGCLCTREQTWKEPGGTVSDRSVFVSHIPALMEVEHATGELEERENHPNLNPQTQGHSAPNS